MEFDLRAEKLKQPCSALTFSTVQTTAEQQRLVHQVLLQFPIKSQPLFREGSVVSSAHSPL